MLDRVVLFLIAPNETYCMRKKKKKLRLSFACKNKQLVEHSARLHFLPLLSVFLLSLKIF